MLLYALLTYIGLAAAAKCRIIGPEFANCRSCPGNCDIKSTFPSGSFQDIDRLWNRGEEILGNERWGYNGNRDCFVSLVRLGDCNFNAVTQCGVSIPVGLTSPSS